MRVRLASLVVAALVATAGLAIAPANAAQARHGRHHHVRVTTVVSGLDNPRDLAVAKDGELFVAEAGRGGPYCTDSGPEGRTCLGFTSAISRVNVRRGTAHPVVSGLVSTASPDGSFATGIDGISVLGERIYGIETGASQFVPHGAFPLHVERKAKREFGGLIAANEDSGRWRSVANVGAHDYRWTLRHKNLVPGQFPDANPYGVLALPGSSWVVDAGANTIDHVSSNGHVRVRAFIPNPPASDAVPTCIDRGWDGALYVGELTGGGNAPGSSVVWRYQPGTDRLTKWAWGLTAVTGCGFGADGRFYVTEFSSNGLDNAAPNTGRVVRVKPHTGDHHVIVRGLSFPGGFAARGHSLFVSNWSVAPATGGGGFPSGSVVRIRLH